MKIQKFLPTIALCALSLAGLAACGTTTGAVTVKIGVCGTSNDQWKAAQYVLNEQNANINIELVEFSKYNIPNSALNSGEIDLNAFQHKAYLNNDCTANGYKVESIGESLIAPLTLYPNSTKNFKSLDDIKNAVGTLPENTTSPSSNALKIAIPNDGTNQCRGIKLLETAGFITVDPSVGYSPEMKDITSYLYNIEVYPIDANTLTSNLSDPKVAGATINGTWATSAGLIPSKDGICIEKQDESGNNPYVNIICARTADKDNETYKKVVEAFRTQTVAEYMLTKYNETYFPAFDYTEFTAEEGAALVAKVDAAIKW